MKSQMEKLDVPPVDDDEPVDDKEEPTPPDDEDVIPHWEPPFEREPFWSVCRIVIVIGCILIALIVVLVYELSKKEKKKK